MNVALDLDKMKTLRNHFQTRIEERAKSLFVHDKDKNFQGYSRMCPSNVRRQPVSLTQSELDEIKRKSPNYLNEENGDILQYTSNPDNLEDPEKNYYICPRYWCLLTNSPISEEEVKSGKCGKIIEKENVKHGHYIYEFNKSHKQYPGFHANKTMDNKYLPCCFKTNKSNQKNNKGPTIQEDNGASEIKEIKEGATGAVEEKEATEDKGSTGAVEEKGSPIK